MNTIGRYPFFKLIPPFVLGIALAFYNLNFFSTYIILWLSLLTGMVICLAAFYKQFKKHSVWIIMASLLLLGISITVVKYDINQAAHFSKSRCAECNYVVVITSDVKESQFNYSAFARVTLKNSTTNGWEVGAGNIYIAINKHAVDSLPIKGSRFIVNSTLFQEIPDVQYPTKFNFKHYAAVNNTFYQVKLKKHNKLEWKQVGYDAPNFIENLANSLSNYISLKLKYYFKADAGIMEGLLLGQKQGIPEEVKANFASVGIMHFLAVSGLHVGIIYLLLVWLLSGLKSVPNGYLWQSVVIVILLWFYALVTGLSPSVVRAVTMFSFIALGKLMYRTPNIYNAIFISAFIILLFNPLVLFSLSFQLSYMAVLGIVYFYPKLMSVYAPNKKLIKYCWSIIAVSLSAQLATLPITISTFHNFPTYFLLANLVLLPVLTVLLIGGIFLLILSFLPSVAFAFSVVLHYLISFTKSVTTKIADLPMGNWQQLYPSNSILWLLLLTAILIVNYFVNRRKVYLSSALISLMVALAISTYDNYKISIRKEVIVLPSKSAIPVLLVKGKSVWELSNVKGYTNYSTKSIMDDMADIKKLEHHNVLKEVKKGSHIYQWFDKTFVMIDKTLVLKNVKQPLKVDCIFIAENYSVSLNDILTNFKPNEVIIGANVDEGIKAEWEKKVDKVHDLSLNSFYEATI